MSPVHPLIAQILARWQIAPRSHVTTVDDPEGEPHEVDCERCGDTGREWGSDAPCSCEAGEPGRKTP